MHSMVRILLSSVTCALLAPTWVGLMAAEGGPADTASWLSITDDVFKKLGVYDSKPAYVRRCIGMIVVPSGEVFALLGMDHGVLVSKDQGGTWTECGGKVNGRCESSFGFSVGYPYNGRLAFFPIDGTGGISGDGGMTWRPFGRILRNFEFADADWGAKEPQTFFGLTHEPYFTVLSTDGGVTWKQLYKDAENGSDSSWSMGVIDATTLVRYHAKPGVIEVSTDLGKTWTEAAKYTVLGRRPVHYGRKTYWATAQGVIVTANGKDWTLTGSGAEKAAYGPFFAASEQEFVVVTDKSFLLTKDGGSTWTALAPAFHAPDAYHQQNYYGWDPSRKILYAAGLGSSIFRLQLK
jgi:hypothetical protein